MYKSFLQMLYFWIPIVPIDFQNIIRCFWKKRWEKSTVSSHVNEKYRCLFTISSMGISQICSVRKVRPGNGSGEKWVHEICQGNGLRKKMSPGNESRKCQGNGLGKKWVQEMSPGTGSRKWVQEKISFTDSSSTDAISQGNAQMYGPNICDLQIW